MMLLGTWLEKLKAISLILMLVNSDQVRFDNFILQTKYCYVMKTSSNTEHENKKI